MQKLRITLWSAPDFPYTVELNRAVEWINESQSFYEIVRVIEPLPELNSNNALNFTTVHRRKRTKYGEAPVIVATHLPLKDGWIAYPQRDFYIFTTGRNSAKPNIPPLSTLFAYFVACILGNLECRMTTTQADTRTHQGRPIGCISDYCDTDEDIYVSMRMLHICDKCRSIHRRYGISEDGLSAIEQLLKVIKEDAQRYEDTVPFDAFVSYSSTDASAVDLLVDHLRKQRFKVWYDHTSLLPGEQLHGALQASVEESTTFIFVMSKQSVASKWCNEELDAALTAKARVGRAPIILPVMLEECEPPPALKDWKFADLRRNHAGKEMEKLCVSVRSAKCKRAGDA